MGPYNTPLALSREPLTAAFFTFCAPLLFPVIAVALATALFAQGETLSTSAGWMVVCIGVGLQFLALTLWSEAIGAGPFAGRMATTYHWVLIAIIAGPIMLYGPMTVIGALMPQNEDWIFREGMDPDVFTRANWTISFMFYAIILAPVVEEVTYRGVAMGAILSRGFGPVVAAVIASIAFTLPHIQYTNLAMLGVFVTGLGFAALRVLSGTIIVPIIAHISANLISFIL